MRRILSQYFVFVQLFLSCTFIFSGYCLRAQTDSESVHLKNAKSLIESLKYADAESELNQFLAVPHNLENKHIAVIAYDLMAEINFQTGKMNVMNDYNSRVLPIATELKDTLLIVEVYNRKGIFEMQNGNAKEAENHFRKALSLGIEKNKSAKTAEIYSNLASNYLTAGEKDKAIEWFFKSLQLQEKIGDKEGQGETYSNIASVYYLMGRVDDAIQFQKKSVAVREQINATSGLVINHTNLGQLYLLKNQMEEAYSHLKKSAEYAEMTQNSKLMGSAYSGLAVYFNKAKDHHHALEWYSKAIKIFEESDNKPLLSRLYVSAANSATETNDTARASEYYKKGLEISLLLKNKENISNAYEKLSTYYQNQNQPQIALDYYKKYVIYRDSINSTSNLAKIEEIRTQYETEKKDNEILRLQTEQKISDLEIEKQKAIISGNLAEAERIQNEIDLLAKTQALNDLKIKQQDEELEKQELLAKTNQQELLLARQQKEIDERKLANQRLIRNILIGGLGILLLLGWGLFNRFKLKKKLEQQEALLSVRNHIARDLHDKVGSTLTGIKILSEVSAKNMKQQDDKTISFVRQITEQTKSIQQEISDIVWAINPNNDKIENLVVRMREYLAQTLEPKEIDIQMNVEKEALVQNLNMGDRKEFFLIFREAVHNIAKHSEAQKVEISVTKKGNFLEMKIHDDGKGMNTLENTFSNGLKNMEIRAKSLKGNLKINSEPGKGTTICLEFPAT